VVFDVSEGAKSPDQVNPGLDRAARLANMLAAGGVTAGKRHIVAVVHGAATDAVVSDTAYAARHSGQKNPNTALIAALQAGGVSVRICGQAMTGQKIAAPDLAPGVQLDLAALMTVTNLQFQGYALVVD
jgi:intracellular sulfur oxidation DsrE/DsrF family protein